MRQTVTLSKKDIRRIVGLKDRLVAMVAELEGSANGAAPARRRRRKKAEPQPKLGARLFEGIKEPRRKRAAPALTPPA